MKAAGLVFPGINRERDMARTLKLTSGHEPAMVWHAERELPAGTDLVVIPGGFSYGDYLRCGAIAARAPIMDAVRAYAAKGGLEPCLRGCVHAAPLPFEFPNDGRWSCAGASNLEIAAIQRQGIAVDAERNFEFLVVADAQDQDALALFGPDSIVAAGRTRGIG